MKDQTRRTFISTAAALTAGVTAASAYPFITMEPKEKKQLTHHVFFWLKNPESKQDLDTLIEGLKTLRKIETVKKLYIGVPASTEKRDVVDNSYQVSELMFFDNVEGQNAYQVHPLHKKFIDNYSHLWERVLVYDSIDV
jgi:aminoglycoside phosphotransferase (APT) family kinase protein